MSNPLLAEIQAGKKLRKTSSSGPEAEAPAATDAATDRKAFALKLNAMFGGSAPPVSKNPPPGAPPPPTLAPPQLVTTVPRSSSRDSFTTVGPSDSTNTHAQAVGAGLRGALNRRLSAASQPEAQHNYYYDEQQQHDYYGEYGEYGDQPYPGYYDEHGNYHYYEDTAAAAGNILSLADLPIRASDSVPDVTSDDSISVAGLRLNARRELAGLTADEVASLLHALELGRYAATFASLPMRGADLASATDADLSEAGVGVALHRRALLSQVAAFVTDGVPAHLLAPRAGGDGSRGGSSAAGSAARTGAGAPSAYTAADFAASGGAGGANLSPRTAASVEAAAAAASAVAAVAREASTGAEAAHLVEKGHEANARGDFGAARELFLRAHAAQGKAGPQLSAANMALKLGDSGVALREYEALLLRADLSEAHRQACHRKIGEAMRATSATQNLASVLAMLRHSNTRLGELPQALLDQTRAAVSEAKAAGVAPDKVVAAEVELAEAEKEVARRAEAQRARKEAEEALKAAMPGWFGAADAAKLRAAIEAARGADVAAATLAAAEAKLLEVEKKEEARHARESEQRRRQQEAEALRQQQQERRQREATAAAAVQARARGNGARARLAAPGARERLRAENARARLVREGKEANAAGDAARARACFLDAQAGEWPSSQEAAVPFVAAAISAANMALKLGDSGVAAAEYEALLQRPAHLICAKHREMATRKLAEARGGAGTAEVGGGARRSSQAAAEPPAAPASSSSAAPAAAAPATASDAEGGGGEEAATATKSPPVSWWGRRRSVTEEAWDAADAVKQAVSAAAAAIVASEPLPSQPETAEAATATASEAAAATTEATEATDDGWGNPVEEQVPEGWERCADGGLVRSRPTDESMPPPPPPPPQPQEPQPRRPSVPGAAPGEFAIQLSVRVSGWAEADGHTLYTVETTACCARGESAPAVTHSCEARRRYTDFTALHAALAPLLPSPPFPVDFPVPKRMLTNLLDSLKRERAAALAAYLQTAVDCAGGAPPEPLLAFMCVDHETLCGAAAVAAAESARSSATEAGVAATVVNGVTGFLSSWAPWGGRGVSS